MAVFLGDSGYVEIRRDSDPKGLLTKLDPNDVNVIKKRFSVDFSEDALLSGDQVDIETVDGSVLELVADHVGYNEWRGYIHVDDAGGIRLYDRFENAIQGNKGPALDLVEPSVAKQVRIRTRSTDFNFLARIQQYELTTSRDQVDITVLGQEHKNWFDAGLITGQGTLSCLWEHFSDCEDECSLNEIEFSAYLARLVLRLQQGSDFEARFYIYASQSAEANSLWYEAKCVISNVALTVSPTQIPTTEVQFLTTGPVQLKQGIPPYYLLQENGEVLLQEDGSGILLEDPN